MGIVAKPVKFDLGTVTIIAGDYCLLGVLLPGQTRIVPGEPSAAAEMLAERVCRLLSRYFAGEPTSFVVPLDLSRLGAFHRCVLAALAEIPWGKVITYAELAERVCGTRRAARAVGRAVAHNPFPLILPCHRVVAHGLRPGGYGGGTELKRFLLQLEGITYVRWT